jgi:hypothetical protein
MTNACLTIVDDRDALRARAPYRSLALLGQTNLYSLCPPP